MDQSEKDALFSEAGKQVRATVDLTAAQIPQIEHDIEKVRGDILRARSFDEKVLAKKLFALYTDKLNGFRSVVDSPYFARCDATIEGKRDVFSFGKYAIPEQSIYSWVSPASRMRFSTPGPIQYMSHGGKEIAGVLHRNDQYLIGGGEIIFMAVATESIPRTLIYQKYFSDRKSTFALPEIVERMERAQDDVIRADHRGSFLISGPAGSGKTTLALHRVAYLLQSPEFQKIFHPEDILILVQDDATKAYFDALLPSLGILNVSISTFSLWARERLELSVYDFVSRYGTNELERDRYEHAKAQALLHETSASFSGKQPFVFLMHVYESFLDSDLQKCFSKQRKEKVLDRFDLTILLAARMRAEGGLFKREKIYAEYTGEARFHWEMVPVRYSLILLDEIQNYLPEQVRIIRSCISPHTDAMTYIGDLSQQTSLATLRDWDSIGERFGEGRAITLEKVYRSTRQILRYVQGEGYAVELTPELREGKAVTVLPKPFREDECSRILASFPQDTLVGILGITPEDIEPYYSFASSKVRVLTVNHAQGVEFDAVIFLYPSLDFSLYPKSLLLEKQKVLKDQIYVALTRAMHELYVVR